MKFIAVLAVLVSLAGLGAEPVQQSFHTVWHTRGPAVVEEQVRGSWTVETEVLGIEDGPVPERRATDSLGVDITARSAVVIDTATGASLWEKNADEVRAIGSITKLMTALIFLEKNPGWDMIESVTAVDRTVGGRQHIVPGDKMTLRDFFNVSLIGSDNDATMVLARSTGLSKEEFVKEMNAKAVFLGMKHTYFSDPTGLSDTNVSTAEEVIKLATAAFRKSEIRTIANEAEYSFTSETGRDYTIVSTNKLLHSFLDIAAAKTGYINLAGYCIVAEVEDSGNTILVAILGSETDPDRFQDLKMLSYWTWQNFIWPSI